ncbi:MAG: carbohydrate kinase family protein [Desulfarculus sp.]|nr:carbohydrate kinase family protein [Desulfarculus sp.]
MTNLPAVPPSEERSRDVLCLGLNAADHLCLIPHRPEWGGKLRMKTLTTMGGGQAATAACALGRLGWRVAYAGVCGDDDPGRQAGPWLRECGVDPAGLLVRPGTGSQQAFIMVEERSGERTIIWTRDEACRLEPEDLDEKLIASARVLHLDGHFWQASIAAARLAKAHGLLVSLDAERIFAGTEELISLCDVVMGCEDFAQRLFGIENPERALGRLAGLGPAWVGRTLGRGGAEMLVEGRRYFAPGFAVDTVDTTGAGDVFHAGLVHAILLGQDPGTALTTANALAAISTTGLGGRAALATRPQLEAFLASHPRRA